MNDTEPDRDPVELLADEFVARVRRGEQPSISEYTRRYPRWADDLLEVLPAVQLLEDLKGPQRPWGGEPPIPPVLGDYRLVREVGRGGMGIVYEAVQLALGRRVALKVLLGAAKAGVDRFRREAQAAGRLHHTNIVPVFGVGEDHGHHYYVMQFIDGEGFDQVLARTAKPGNDTEVNAPLACGNPKDTVRLIVQVADALAYAHQMGVVHRDIKPANLLLDPAGVVWVTDFGLAKVIAQEDLTRPGDVAGTLRYSAPERFKGQSGPASDLFSLGLTMYELLTHRPAYDERDPGRLLRRVMDGHIDPPAGLPPDLLTILLRLLAPEPERRYASAADLADDLRRFLDDRPIRARREGPLERCRRWCRRNPAVASLWAALTLACAAGFGGVLWKWREAENAATALRDSLAREAGERGRAEENLSLALEGFERIAGRLTPARPGAPLDDGEGPGAPPVVSREAAEVLNDMVQFYERFAAANGDDGRLTRETVRALRRVGTLQMRLARFPEAEAALERALGLLERSAGEELEVAQVRNDLGVIFRSAGRPVEAQLAHQEALKLLDGRECLETARTRHLLGAVQWRLGLVKPAVGHLRDGLAMLEKLDGKRPDSRHLVARTHHELGLALPGPEGHESRRIAVEIMEGLAKDFPQVPDYRAELAEALLATPPRPFLPAAQKGTEKRIRRAVELANDLTRAYPNAPEYRALLARARQRLGVNLTGQGRIEEGVKEMRQAVALLREVEGRVAAGPGARYGLLETRLQLAEGLRLKGEWAEVRSLLEPSVADLERIVRVMPRNKVLRGLLVRGYRALAQACVKLGAMEKAAAYAKKADEVK